VIPRVARISNLIHIRLSLGEYKAVKEFHKSLPMNSWRHDLMRSRRHQRKGILKALNEVHAVIERQARLIQTFATKLGLPQQSRYTAATAAVVASKAQEKGRGMKANDTKSSSAASTIDLN
jgi:hypothetical protein